MNREIKFRAWLPGIGKMTYAHTLDVLMNWNTKPEDNGTAIWLQYTGLKDKNGKEIYEGDIVRSTSNMEEYFDLVEWDNEDGAWKFENTQGLCVVRWDDIDHESAEVIGNIHEHPQLMKGESQIEQTSIERKD